MKDPFDSFDSFGEDADLEEVASEIKAQSFEIGVARTTGLIDSEELFDDFVVDFLDSEGVTGGTKEKPDFFLAEGDIEVLLEIDDFDIGQSNTQIALRPSEQVLAIYRPEENEIALFNARNSELSSIMNNAVGQRRELATKLREYLNKPIFDIFPKNLMFTTKKYQKDEDFRSFIISRFMNTQSPQLHYTTENLLEDVISVYQAEYQKEISTKNFRLIKEAVTKYVSYAASIMEEADAKFQITQYSKDSVQEVVCPEAITNDSYVCVCGEHIYMPYERPPLCFFVSKIGGSINVRTMNLPVPCTCGRVLALPEALASSIEVRAEKYIKKAVKTVDSWRIYRPKLDDLETLIPADASELFQFHQRTGTIIEAEAVSVTSVGNNYKRLIDLWMGEDIAKIETKQFQAQFDPGVFTNNVSGLMKELSAANLRIVPELYAHQFIKSVIYYLEEFSLFALTEKTKAIYDYYELDSIERKSFDCDYTNKWIIENAWALAGVKNIYSGDKTITDLGILPEYVESLNYVLILNMLSEESIINPKSELGKWLKEPSSKRDFFTKKYELLETPEHQKLVTSHRLLFDKATAIDSNAWSDLYKFIRAVGAKYRRKAEPEIRDIITAALRSSEEEFYGVKLKDSLLIRPTLRFEEFKKVFADYGWELFSGPMINEKKKNLAKALILYSHDSSLDTLFLSTPEPKNKLSSILLEKKERHNQTLLLKEIFKKANLPGDLNQIRDSIGSDAIVENLEEYIDEFRTDMEFMGKFGEAIKCYL